MTPFEANILIQQGLGSGLEQALKTRKLNPNSRFKQESLLSTTIKKKVPNLLKLLLHHGGDPNLVSYENGRYEPAIITAVRYKSLTCVQILLSYGANLDKRNFYGTDAIFQAVHENAFDILDYLLDNYHPPYVPPLPLQCSSSSSSPSILIQERAEVGSTTGAAALKIKELPSNNKEHDVDDHVLCPFYYALSHSLSYPCKRQSLVQLLQSYYKCKCLEEIASCTKLSSEMLPPTAVAGFPHKEGIGNEGKVETEQERELRKCLIMLLASPGQDHSLQEKSVGAEGPDRDSHGVLVDFGNGDDIKFQNEFNYPYKIYKIEGKCHAIKENESSAATRLSSSYVLSLSGPLKLSCIVREVIRDQIMLYAMNSISSRTNSVATTTSIAVASAPTNLIRNRKNFVKSLKTLPIPSSLMDFLLYKNIKELKNNIQLMNKDPVLNTNYFSIYIYE